MKILFIASLLFLTSLASVGYTLLIRTFGNAKDKPLLFLHNGPGYNCANFEGTIAKKLAENGFYVIVYMTNVSEKIIRQKCPIYF